MFVEEEEVQKLLSKVRHKHALELNGSDGLNHGKVQGCTRLITGERPCTRLTGHYKCSTYLTSHYTRFSNGLGLACKVFGYYVK